MDSCIVKSVVPMICVGPRGLITPSLIPVMCKDTRSLSVVILYSVSSITMSVYAIGATISRRYRFTRERFSLVQFIRSMLVLAYLCFLFIDCCSRIPYLYKRQ